MKRSITTTIALSCVLILLGQGCPLNPVPSSTPDDQVRNTMQDASYLGTWQRLDVIVNGESMGSGAASLELKSDSFISTGVCTVTGSLAVSGDQMTMVTESEDCPGPTPGTTTYTYEITDDGQTMKTTTVADGVTIVELYSR